MRNIATRFASTLPVYNWVKNVYSLCILGGNKGVYTFTTPSLIVNNSQYLGVKPHFYTQVLASFTPTLYTRFSAFLPLLKVQLFTLSTPPIITKTN